MESRDLSSIPQSNLLDLGEAKLGGASYLLLHRIRHSNLVYSLS